MLQLEELDFLTQKVMSSKLAEQSDEQNRGLGVQNRHFAQRE